MSHNQARAPECSERESDLTMVIESRDAGHRRLCVYAPLAGAQEETCRSVHVL